KFYRKIDPNLTKNLLKEEFSLKGDLHKPDEEALKLIEGEIKQVAEEEFNRIHFPTDPFGFFPLDKYHRYDEIVQFVKKLVEHYAHIAQLFKIGDTYEKRPIYGVKIGKPRTDGALKKGIFIDAGVHAREWIAPAACLCVMNAFVRDYNKNMTITKLVDNLDWYFVPNANPDGYEYTWNKDRMWRKTTAPQYCNSTGCCYGVDLNRNWDFHWGESAEGKDPCSEMYPGASPFSEPETKSLSKWIYGLKGQLLSYITLHSYGQMWLIPYGYARNIYAPDFDQLNNSIMLIHF
uniref:Peptidase M14 carboxypeptidase A domain-containing protein n=1 Tax=Romanomermis culicivorax TaxID=13658 RepID=A0A915J6Y2_ROMCU